ncbi:MULTISPECIES: hypothetical protein [unclassified Anabaena]|uniref:hypothetical protein n=1 Tax=unclassified Anabaena TaxID=2619674 RepID=UPI0039C75FCA
MAKKIAENQECLRDAISAPPNLILLDVNMPAMSDYSLEEVIGYTVVELNLGKDKQAIAKPFRPLKLAEKISQALQWGA